jgi:hypothetical protein
VGVDGEFQGLQHAEELSFLVREVGLHDRCDACEVPMQLGGSCPQQVAT